MEGSCLHNMHLAAGDVHLWWLFPEDVGPQHPPSLLCCCAVVSQVRQGTQSAACAVSMKPVL